jgi:hypothetical protein
LNTVEIAGYLLAFFLGCDILVSTRLFKTGETQLAAKKAPLLVLLYALCSAAISLSAIFYFSWKFLGWSHYLVFFLTVIIIGERLAKLESMKISWIITAVATIITGMCEIVILRSI